MRVEKSHAGCGRAEGQDRRPYDRGAVDGSRRRGHPLLAARLNDKAIAQELRISASTLNRRIADLMTTFEAKTRFSARPAGRAARRLARRPGMPARAA